MYPKHELDYIKYTINREMILSVPHLRLIDEKYNLNLAGKDNSPLYLTENEYAFVMQGLKNQHHALHSGIISQVQDKSSSYLKFKDSLHLPLAWFNIELIKRDSYNFDKCGAHFFMKCSSLDELNIVVNQAEDLGYKLIQYTFDTYHLEMKKTKGKF